MATHALSADPALPEATHAAKWPYVLALALLVTGAALLAYAPISAATYVGLPGISIALYWGFAYRSPLRFAIAASTAAFAIGFVIAAGGLALSISGYVSQSFMAQEFGSIVVLGGMIGLPLLGVLIGIPAVAMAVARPGERPAPAEPVGGID